MGVMDQVKEGYDKWADRYDDDDPSTVLDEPWVLQLVGPLAGRRVLDLACGTGRYARLLTGQGARAHGADASRKMLLRARPLPCVQAAAHALPFADASFDALTC